jgi:hypothetical protein
MTPRELAAEHAARRRARLARIRKTVAAVSVCVFIALFAGIYVQMAVGRDPALGTKAAVTKKATKKATPSDQQATPSVQQADPAYTQPSPVTTSQS